MTTTGGSAPRASASAARPPSSDSIAPSGSARAVGLFGLARPAEATPVQVGLFFQNDLSDNVVCYLYVKPNSQYVWGGDRLGDRVLLPGEHIEVPLLPGRFLVENYRTGFVWNVMKTNQHIIRGLQRAGFTGGWLP